MEDIPLPATQFDLAKLFAEPATFYSEFFSISLLQLGSAIEDVAYILHEDVSVR